MILSLIVAAAQAPNPAIFLAVSETGRQWRVFFEPIARMAYAPDAILLPQNSPLGKRGEIYVYFIDGDDGKLKVSRSANSGATWTDRISVEVASPASSPAVAIGPDGTMRLFLGSEQGVDVFESSDAVRFKPRGVALSAVGAADPEVLLTKDGWLMFFSLNGETRAARSSDGFVFELDEKVRFRGFGSTGGYLLADNTIRLFFAGNGIWSRASRDGVNFVNESGYHLTPVAGTQIGNPSAVQLLDGRHLLFCDVSWVPTR